MKLFCISAIVILSSCASNSQVISFDKNKNSQEDILFRFSLGDIDKGAPVGYKNGKGEIVIPLGFYETCLTDTIIDFGVVLDPKKTNNKWMAIDVSGKHLFEVFNYDNGPDYIEDGLFRIVKDGKIGFANTKGEIVIPCLYACAFYFENGKAQVSLDCEKIREHEHERWQSESWFYINKKGEKVNP